MIERPSNSHLDSALSPPASLAPSSPSVIRRLAESSLALPALVLLCLAAYLPGLFTIPPIDRDESRFAQASRQMFESVTMSEPERAAAQNVGHSGGLAVPYVQDKPRLNKPPLIYWLQSASAAIFTGGKPLDDAIWMYRIPGVLCSIGAVAVVWRLALSMYAGVAGVGAAGGVGSRARLIALVGAGSLAISPVVIIDAHQARADQLLLLTVVFTQWMLWKITQGDRRFGVAVLFWLFIALGVISKGPITPLVAALTALSWSVLRREWRWMWSMRPLLGVVVVGAVVAPWVYAVASHIGFERYWRTIWDETIGRSVEGKEGHWGPPGYHLLLVFFLLWPVSLGIPGAFASFWRTFRNAHASSSAERLDSTRLGFRERLRLACAARPSDAFLLAWIIPGWVVFELVSTKLPHYTLPLYPALCILASAWLVEVASSTAQVSASPLDKSTRSTTPIGFFLHLTRFWFGTGFVVLAGIGALTLSLSWWEALGWWKSTLVDDPSPRTNWFLVVPIVAMIAFMVVSGRSLARMRTVESLGLAACAIVIGFGLLLGTVAPIALSLSTRIVNAIEPTGGRNPIILFGYNEDSLIYLTRGKAQRGGTVHSRSQTEVIAESTNPVPEIRDRATLLRGLNIAKGRCETVLVLKPEIIAVPDLQLERGPREPK